ncbi:hypothetical protein AMAG_17059 [Allomyces macrogynus ATCC 38327]|uniref:Uncharacterized protein n=1 Tax=Allomyces macrogynus (strain ATCC 38327) TaxID=578462 RepID=A0A0L0TDR6_ALLM3|nr:hypothetical protein AMAG_17059 [Allomyces macrogynus ATCC 38327]|eukprot:KNE72724.1 hypothetical protein AMAG_17059 [Allomyces macrogynus ATCC 38327]
MSATSLFPPTAPTAPSASAHPHARLHRRARSRSAGSMAAAEAAAAARTATWFIGPTPGQQLLAAAPKAMLMSSHVSDPVLIGCECAHLPLSPSTSSSEVSRRRRRARTARHSATCPTQAHHPHHHESGSSGVPPLSTTTAFAQLACDISDDKWVPFLEHLTASPHDATLADPRTGRPLLYHALDLHRNQFARYLLEAYPDRDDDESDNDATRPFQSPIRDFDGETPLLVATRAKNHDMCEAILEQWPPMLHTANVRGETPLLAACRAGSEWLVALFLDRGASLTSADHDGNTALHFAAAYGHFGIVSVLVARGANFMVRNKKQWTPLDYSYSETLYAFFLDLIRDVVLVDFDPMGVASTLTTHSTSDTPSTPTLSMHQSGSASSMHTVRHTPQSSRRNPRALGRTASAPEPAATAAPTDPAAIEEAMASLTFITAYDPPVAPATQRLQSQPLAPPLPHRSLSVVTAAAPTSGPARRSTRRSPSPTTPTTPRLLPLPPAVATGPAAAGSPLSSSSASGSPLRVARGRPPSAAVTAAATAGLAPSAEGGDSFGSHGGSSAETKAPALVSYNAFLE